MPTSGSPPTTLAYQSEENPSASARFACSIILSGVDAPPVSPMRTVSSVPKERVEEHYFSDAQEIQLDSSVAGLTGAPCER